MRNQIASEFRKLVTTRSVYAMLAGLVVIVGLGVVATTTDAEPGSLLAPLEHRESAIVAAVERAFLQRLEGGCQVPMACHAVLDGETVRARGLVIDPEGEALHEARATGAPSEAATLGRELAETLLSQGAGAILERHATSRRH